jgi:hypothetical protein
MRRPRWRERILWKPVRGVFGVSAWRVAIACVLIVLLGAIWEPRIMHQVPREAYVAMVDSSGAPTGGAWPGNTASSASKSGVTLTVSRSYAPPSTIGLGLLKPWATAGLTASLQTASGFWEAPPGTTPAEILDKARGAGLPVQDSFLDIPDVVCEEIYRLPTGSRPRVGTHWHLVGAAALFDAVHLLLIVAATLLAFGLFRMVFTTRAERMKLRVPMGMCEHCGYERGGIPERVPCPECGGLPTGAS